jgi:phage-related protein
MTKSETAKPILTVRFYSTATGNEPVRTFLKELRQEERKIIGTDIKEVQFGWPLGMPLVRKIDTNLWEVRSTLDGKVARMLFTVVDAEIVLLHALIKKSQQTPKGDLVVAKKRLAEIKGESHGK